MVRSGASGTGTAELYDLDADIYESTYVSEQHSETVAELRKAWQDWHLQLTLLARRSQAALATEGNSSVNPGGAKKGNVEK